MISFIKILQMFSKYYYIMTNSDAMQKKCIYIHYTTQIHVYTNLLPRVIKMINIVNRMIILLSVELFSRFVPIE